ncbi:sulfite exporter TauE/SafE family protein [Candidatus Lokiarchaeum ossiferum]|uniref:sulfite exporter TauE/SafE family protein n=1 Tax=Candidatus Lokiarchaeum ossiferum TaxID=2951803 RepID=UPI00352BECAC
MMLSLAELSTMTFMSMLLMIFLGFFIGIITSISGIGGGAIIMPFLLLILNMDHNYAKGTSLFLILLSSGIATLYNIKQKKISISIILFTSFFGILGSISCFIFQKYLIIEERIFFILFGLFEVIMAFRMIFKAKLELKNISKSSITLDPSIDKSISPSNSILKIEHNSFWTNKKVFRASPFFFITGFLTTFFGIGGGPITTPVFHEILHIPITSATASSSAMIFVNSIINVIYYGIQGEIQWVFGVIIGIGMMVGSYTGVFLSNHISKSMVYFLIGILLGILGTVMIIGFFV